MEKDNQVLLSICLPTYNRAAHIKRQLSFVLEEAGPYLGAEIEVLVSNNSSTDDTDEVIKEIALGFPKPFCYVVQPRNLGGIGNIKYLVQQAAGRYVWVVGDDDILKPGIVQIILDVIHHNSGRNIGVVLLGYAFNQRSNEGCSWHDVNWENLKQADIVSVEGIQPYRSDNTDLYEFSGIHGNLNFITRCVVQRESYLTVVNSPIGEKQCFPFVCSLLSIKNSGCFYVEREICVLGNCDADISWKEIAIATVSIDVFQCILGLSRFGFTRNEVNPIVKSFLSKNKMWFPLFHPTYKAPMRLRWEFLRMVINSGHFFIFSHFLLVSGWHYLKKGK